MDYQIYSLRRDKILIFCSFAATNSSGVNVNTQLNTKNITKNNKIVEAPFFLYVLIWRSAPSNVLYSRNCEQVKDEIAGEWLNENTNTGMVSHKVVKKPPAVGSSYNTALFHSGIK